MGYQRISFETDGGVARLTLRRAEKRNSVDVAMREEILDALARVRGDDAVGCVLLSAEGRVFCAGQDLEERRPILEGRDLDLGDALEAGFNRIVTALRTLPQPVVAAVQGPAVGAGVGLALACDIVFAARSASLHCSFASIGLAPDTGTSWFLPRKAGPARAAGTLLLGEPITAAQAEAWGLIWACVEDGELLDNATEAALRIAATAPHATRLAKALLTSATGLNLAEQLGVEAEAQSFAGRQEAYRKALARFL